MDKNEYLEWLKTRSKDPTDWDRAKCVEADDLIRHVTLENAAKAFATLRPTVREFLLTMIDFNYGTLEVDQFCMDMRLCPAFLLLPRRTKSQ